jgi:hypothetical protein
VNVDFQLEEETKSAAPIIDDEQELSEMLVLSVDSNPNNSSP